MISTQMWMMVLVGWWGWWGIVGFSLKKVTWFSVRQRWIESNSHMNSHMNYWRKSRGWLGLEPWCFWDDGSHGSLKLEDFFCWDRGDGNGMWKPLCLMSNWSNSQPSPIPILIINYPQLSPISQMIKINHLFFPWHSKHQKMSKMSVESPRSWIWRFRVPSGKPT